MEPGAVKIVPINKYVDVAMKYHRDTLRFPEPQNININMMPFITGEEFEDCKLPENLRQYWDMILNPLLTRYHGYDYDKIGKIGFLTIHECSVEPNTSQRRPGLHTDNPGRMHVGGNGGINGAEYLLKICSIVSEAKPNQNYISLCCNVIDGIMFTSFIIKITSIRNRNCTLHP